MREQAESKGMRATREDERKEKEETIKATR